MKSIMVPVKFVIIPFHVEAGEPRVYVPLKSLQPSCWGAGTPRCIKDQLLYLLKQTLKNEEEPRFIEEVAEVEYLLDERYRELYILGFVRCKTVNLTMQGWFSTATSNFQWEQMLHNFYGMPQHLLSQADAIVARNFTAQNNPSLAAAL